MFQKMTERIAWAIKIIATDSDLDQKISDVALAKILGTNKDTLAGYRQEKGLLKGEVIENLAKCYKFNPQWLLQGEGEPFPGARVKYPEVCGPEQPIFQVIPAQADFPADDFVFIRQVNGNISAGGGLMPDDSADFQCAFRKDWIKKKKGNPNNMSLIKISGDSMDPTLLSGDLVLVDHSRNSIASQGGIYAISINDEIMVKRVQPVFPDGKLRVISDNKQYDTFEISADNARVNGKVIWYARDIER